MRKIVHISDLHFGRIDPIIIEALLEELQQQSPDLVIVSGDITQRARVGQFSAARRFLESIPYPKLTVPGNHDIPLYNIGRRFLSPLGRYKHYINEDLSPSYIDNEMAVFGLNTAHPFTWINGRVSRSQTTQLCSRISEVPSGLFKTVVTHHPFIPPPRVPTSVVGRAKKPCTL